MSIIIWWLRRDLRLADNQALWAALQHGDAVAPVFILDPALLASANVGQTRLAFLLGGLRALDEELRRRGSYLIVRQGEPRRQLAALFGEIEATGIYAEADVTPYARRRDERVAAALPLRPLPGVSLHAPDAVLREDGSPYTVFTPFSKRWQIVTGSGPPAPYPAPARIAETTKNRGQTQPEVH